MTEHNTTAPAEAIIGAIVWAWLIFFAMPDLIRWILGRAPI